MRDVLTKLRILWIMCKGQYGAWVDEVWRRDLDQPYCCDGRDCGCYGTTVRDVYGPSERAT